MSYPNTRLRRLRYNPVIRDMVEDIHLRVEDLIYPLFVCDGKNIKKEIKSMPNQFQFSIDQLPEIFDKIISNKIRSVILFGVPKKKDEHGHVSHNSNGIIQTAIKFIKKKYPEILVIADLCNCQYTTHGHCGTIIDGDVDNDTTVENLTKQAISLVKAGADVLAPSDMMDGRVLHIRKSLDKNGFQKTPIFSYSVKYASAFYGPFRDAANNSPSHGDRKTYQMNFKNSSEAMREIELDINEGADAIIIKPALSYLDIINRVKTKFNIPVIAYNVSGEFSMVAAASENNWIERSDIIFEILISMKRAGASAIISYHALEIAEKLNKNV
tara:strand:+ start:283 stop:1263 length:981 start_codon:yes stop_codon:yes gene_type:complete